ncbi:MAG: CDP-alcohol phosphatidyltransferase family protein [Planctomycetales bacterium]|nr:CDP-alcohol phosphatidyltransferase family protein [Planctomycetales bacterium]
MAFLPSAATLGNLICGLIAILCCLLSIRAEYFEVDSRAVHPILRAFFPSYVAIGAYLVVLAMLFDAVDGRLARMTRQTSEFGSQLDSISDVVSFGAAPVVLLLTILLRLVVPASGDPQITHLEWRIGLTVGLVFVCCAAIRLARFNAENTADESAQRKFSGLPTPGAALGLVSLLLLHQDLVYNGGVVWGIDWPPTLLRVILAAAAVLGFLMVSRIDFVHVFNVYLTRERPPSHLIAVVVVVLLTVFAPQVMLAVGAWAYVASGVILTVAGRGGRSAGPQPPAGQPDWAARSQEN